MSSNSAIEWTETTWNPVVGCTPVSPGCLNCYAATMSNRLQAMGQEQYVGLTVKRDNRHVFNGTVRTLEDRLAEPLGWKKPRRVFVNSMSDLFHESVPFEFIDKVFAVMALCPQHTFQVLTKRPERMAKYLEHDGFAPGWVGSCGPMRDRVDVQAIKLPGVEWRKDNLPPPACHNWPIPNIWLGTSVENHVTAAARIPHLQKCPAAVRFLSVEPQVDEIGWRDEWASGLHWMIGGGESGPRSRPYDVDWARAGIAFARKHEMAWFQKQLGAVPIWDGCGLVANNPPGETRRDYVNGREVRVLVLRDRKGGDPQEWPEDLRVREFPA